MPAVMAIVDTLVATTMYIKKPDTISKTTYRENGTEFLTTAVFKQFGQV